MHHPKKALLGIDNVHANSLPTLIYALSECLFCSVSNYKFYHNFYTIISLSLSQRFSLSLSGSHFHQCCCSVTYNFRQCCCLTIIKLPIHVSKIVQCFAILSTIRWDLSCWHPYNFERNERWAEYMAHSNWSIICIMLNVSVLCALCVFFNFFFTVKEGTKKVKQI